jgi:hypothetical protein
VLGVNTAAFVKTESVDRSNEITLYKYVISMERGEALLISDYLFWGSELVQTSGFVHGDAPGEFEIAASFQRTCIRGVRRKPRVKALE